MTLVVSLQHCHVVSVMHFKIVPFIFSGLVCFYDKNTNICNDTTNSHCHGVVELTNDLPLLKNGNEFVYELPKAVSRQMNFHTEAKVNRLSVKQSPWQ